MMYTSDGASRTGDPMSNEPETAVDPEALRAEAEAAEAAEAEDPAGNSRQWLLETVAGTLCTISSKGGLEGWPFGSVVPYALTGDGRPVIYIATIAAHTANLKADPRASLFVRQTDIEGDPQKGWRVAVMGRMEELVPEDAAEPRGSWARARLTRAELDEVHARYVEKIPFAEDYRLTHGFSYWRMGTIEKVRYIGGFGKICWFPGEGVLRDPGAGGIAEAAPGAIAHMNEDHNGNMIEMCSGLYGFTPESAEMTALDRTGFFVRTRGPDRTVHFSFGREIDAGELRPAVIEVLKRARAAR
jgi:heme iron utilization protein